MPRAKPGRAVLTEDGALSRVQAPNGTITNEVVLNSKLQTGTANSNQGPRYAKSIDLRTNFSRISRNDKHLVARVFTQRVNVSTPQHWGTDLWTTAETLHSTHVIDLFPAPNKPRSPAPPPPYRQAISTPVHHIDDANPDDPAPHK